MIELSWLIWYYLMLIWYDFIDFNDGKGNTKWDDWIKLINWIIFCLFQMNCFTSNDFDIDLMWFHCLEADIARSLLFAISNDIGQIASLYAMMHGLKTVNSSTLIHFISILLLTFIHSFIESQIYSIFKRKFQFLWGKCIQIDSIIDIH